MTTKLSDTQRAVLTAAAAASDRLVRPEDIALKGGAVGIVLTSLFKRGLLEEVWQARGITPGGPGREASHWR